MSLILSFNSLNLTESVSEYTLIRLSLSLYIYTYYRLGFGFMSVSNIIQFKIFKFFIFLVYNKSGLNKEDNVNIYVFCICVY